MRWAWLGMAGVVLGLGANSGFAHDIPNARIERATQVDLGPGRLQVEYEVSLAELTLAQDLRQLDDEPFQGDRLALFERYAKVVGPLNARGFLVAVDGVEVELQAVDFRVVVEDHPRIFFHFAATVPVRGHLKLADTNYTSSEGTTRLGFRAEPDLKVTGNLLPADVASIPTRPVWQMSDEEERRTRRLELDYAPQPVALSTSPERAEPISSPGPRLAPSGGLTRLLDTKGRVSVVGWLAMAFFLGVAHAIQPGHGKTLVAAASLDGPFAASRGVGLGLITAGCHLISVVAIAALLWWFPTRQYGAIHIGIARGAGFVIAAVGSFRLGRHLAGIEPHPDRSAHLGPGGTAGLWSLGLAGGFVPCWDAVALVVLAHAVGQLAWGLTLLASFSLGLALVLVVVGWLAGRWRGRWAGRATSMRWIGLLSGLILIVIGLGLLTS